MEWLLEWRQKEANAGSGAANHNVRNNTRAINFTMSKICHHFKRYMAIAYGCRLSRILGGLIPNPP